MSAVPDALSCGVKFRHMSGCAHDTSTDRTLPQKEEVRKIKTHRCSYSTQSAQENPCSVNDVAWKTEASQRPSFRVRSRPRTDHSFPPVLERLHATKGYTPLHQSRMKSPENVEMVIQKGKTYGGPGSWLPEDGMVIGRCVVQNKR